MDKVKSPKYLSESEFVRKYRDIYNTLIKENTIHYQSLYYKVNPDDMPLANNTYDNIEIVLMNIVSSDFCIGWFGDERLYKIVFAQRSDYDLIRLMYGE